MRTAPDPTASGSAAASSAVASTSSARSATSTSAADACSGASCAASTAGTPTLAASSHASSPAASLSATVLIASISTPIVVAPPRNASCMCGSAAHAASSKAIPAGAASRDPSSTRLSMFRSAQRRVGNEGVYVYRSVCAGTLKTKQKHKQQ